MLVTWCRSWRARITPLLGYEGYSVRGKSGRRFWMVPSSSGGLIYLKDFTRCVVLLVSVVWCVLTPGLLDMA